MKEPRWPGDMTITVEVPDKIRWADDIKKEYRFTRVTYNFRYKNR